jgi:RNA polymerase sigma factor (sigma-70 family)
MEYRVLIEEAYRAYGEAMVGAMTRFSSDEQTARDAVAQAFTKALVHKQMLEHIAEGAMKAWLYAAARNTVIDMKRRDRRLSPLLDEHLSPLRIDETDRLLAGDLLAKLPPTLREPLRLKYFDRMNATEIGKELGLCPATVRTRIRNALRFLRCIVQENPATKDCRR